MGKFEVGDIIIGNKEAKRHYYYTTTGTLWQVTGILDDESIVIEPAPEEYSEYGVIQRNALYVSNSYKVESKYSDQVITTVNRVSLFDYLTGGDEI